MKTALPTARYRGSLAVALIAAFSTLVSGCALTTAPTRTSPQGVTPEMSSVGHIHGLAVDDTDATLYLAAHGGVFTIPLDVTGDAATMNSLTAPIAGRAQDTMGFAYLDGTMYGSGHPDPLNPEGNPPDLGLMVSTDRAQSWQSVSLSGEVDFHDIAVARAHDGAVVLHGFSATTGSILTSYDTGQTWAEGATLAARDLAMAADDSTSLFATTEAGLVVSIDGGTTFADIPGAPSLYLVDSLNDSSGGLIGVDIAGKIWSNTTGAWQNTGTITGSAEALTYSAASNLLVVADGIGISVSVDQGASWRTVLLR